mgnify:CR=1 FL=1
MEGLTHLLLIPDGNRRYAKRKYIAEVLSQYDSLASLPKDIAEQLEERIRKYLQTGRDPYYDENMEDHLKHLDVATDCLQAYRKGATNIDSIIRLVLANGSASTISIYGLQPANLQRKAEEIDTMLQAEIEQFNKWLHDAQFLSTVKFRFVGDLILLESHPKGHTYQEATKILEESSSGQKLDIFILAPYDYRWEINQAIREGRFEESRLIVPPIDLVIRTSGEKRISEAVPIQIRNAEYIFRREYFPDFTLDIFHKVLEEFYNRQRTFGL